jgi:hypothetical protein
MRKPRPTVARNPWQFSLRAILCLTVLASLGAAIYGYHLRREERLRELIEDFFAARHEGRNPDAERIAEVALREFPSRAEAIDMLEMTRLFGPLVEINSPEDAARWLPVEGGAVHQDDNAPAHKGGIAVAVE